MINKISTTSTIKDGYVRSSIIYSDFEILVSAIEQGVVLDKHKHPHNQFGFCISGEFEFISENGKTRLEPNATYLLDSNIEHSAVALSKFTAIDLKYLGMTDITTTDGVTVYTIQGTTKCFYLGGHVFYHCQPSGSLDLNITMPGSKKIYCITPNDCHIIHNQRRVFINAMTIYEVGDQISSMHSYNDLLIIERKL